MSNRPHPSEERAELLAKVNQLKKEDPKLTVKKACDKVGINTFNYYNWSKTRPASKLRRRSKKKPVLVTSLVSTEPKTPPSLEKHIRDQSGGTLSPGQATAIADFAGHMIAGVIKSLTQAGGL